MPRHDALDSRTVARIGAREDYAELAAMADEFGIEFDVLAGRFEGRESIADIRADLAEAKRKRDEWIRIDEAERLVPGLTGVSHAIRTAPRRKLDSKRGATSPRGCGWRWLVADLHELSQIRRECSVSLSAAVRIQEAKHRGAL